MDAEVRATTDARNEIKLTEIIRLVDDRLEYEGKEIDFDYNKADLRGPDTFEILNHVLRILKEHDEVKLHVEGHADSRGDDAHNLKLSKDRAASVRRWFVDNGVDATRLTSDGYGEDMKEHEPERCRDKTGPDALFKDDHDCVKAWHENRHTVFKVVDGVTALRPQEPPAAATRRPVQTVATVERAERTVWLGLFLSKDYAFFPGDNVCSQEEQRDKGFTCVRGDEKQYHGTPVEGAGNALLPAPHGSTTRLLGAIDVVVSHHLTLGGRIGYAFGGGPESDDASKFLPLHAEARITYWFMDHSFSRLGFRPFAFLSGGVAQVDTKVEGVSVKEQSDCSIPAANLGFCEVIGSQGQHVQWNPQGQTVNVWHQSGKGFFGLGLGSMYALAENHGPVLEVRLSRMSSQDTWALSPALGYMVGF